MLKIKNKWNKVIYKFKDQSYENYRCLPCLKIFLNMNLWLHISIYINHSPGYFDLVCCHKVPLKRTLLPQN